MTEAATLAGGCFWCFEAMFGQLRGVLAVKSGYAGGHAANPTYKQVCTGRTGHAEAVRVLFDPDEISYEDLLDVFFTSHDPTTLNRQGPDVGTQYRSALFFESEAQERTARAKLAEVEEAGLWPDPIVTEIAPLAKFWPAETMHDDYLSRNPGNPYCAAVVAPKVAKFRKKHFQRLRRAAVGTVPSASAGGTVGAGGGEDWYLR